MSDFQLAEEHDYWLLPLKGRSVTQCCVDYAFTIYLVEPDAAFSLRIEQPFVLHQANADAVTLDPEENVVALAPALAMFGLTVERGVAYKDGWLEVCFTDGSSIRVDADNYYEAWTLSGPAGLLVVSMPGGNLAIWLAEGG